MRWQVYLHLGRVSNLPTVWTNVLAGTALAGGATPAAHVAVLAVACSLFYVGGMYLNDAFDREVDARERSERPIPSGQIGAGAVFAIGFGLLAAALVVLAAASAWWGGGRLGSVGAGLVLAGVITYYDAYHKANPWSPVVMGLCRVLVYATAALAVAGRVSGAVVGGAAVLLSYLIGLTYVAKQENLARYENLWPLLFLFVPFAYAAPALVAGPIGAVIHLGFLGWVGYAVSLLVRRGRADIRQAVVSMIAGISLLDALLIARSGDPIGAGWAVLGFVLTLLFQRWVPGT